MKVNKMSKMDPAVRDVVGALNRIDNLVASMGEEMALVLARFGEHPDTRYSTLTLRNVEMVKLSDVAHYKGEVLRLIEKVAEAQSEGE